MNSDWKIEDGQVWIAFDSQELEWLQELIPPGDEFRQDIREAIARLESKER